MLLMLDNNVGENDDGLLVSDVNRDLFHDVPLEIRLVVLRSKEPNILNY